MWHPADIWYSSHWLILLNKSLDVDGVYFEIVIDLNARLSKKLTAVKKLIFITIYTVFCMDISKITVLIKILIFLYTILLGRFKKK